MSEQPNIPTSKSPFWRFSVKFYAVPGVAPACIELQDQAGVDVNVLFFLLWNATQSRTFSRAQVDDIERKIGAWRDIAVVPLRAVRRALRSPPPAIAPDVAEGFRTRIKAVELEAERLQQEALYDLARFGPLGGPAASPIEAARGSIAAYEMTLRPFPKTWTEAILAAFSRFDAPE
jgi:uncharacterized protein (TIGR02444 family)